MDALVDEVDQSPDGPTVGAFFDFDGTPIYGFSAIALQVARLRRRDVSPQEVVHALRTGRLGPFKKGAFRVAMAGGVPVVPIVFRNACDVWPLGTQFMRPGTVDVVVHPPIPTDEWTDADLDTRIAEVRRLYLDTLADWPAP